MGIYWWLLNGGGIVKAAHLKSIYHYTNNLASGSRGIKHGAAYLGVSEEGVQDLPEEDDRGEQQVRDTQPQDVSRQPTRTGEREKLTSIRAFTSQK